MVLPRKTFRPGRRIGGGVAGAAAVFVLAGCASATGAAEGGRSDLSKGHLISAASGQGHELREVPAEEAPSVELEVTEDPWGTGWTVEVVTGDFEFAPERLGELRPQEGHARLYLDGEKIDRIYSPWYALPASEVPAGEHELSVTLNANDDHAVWAVDGEPVEASTTLDGIDAAGSSDDSHDHGQGDGHEHDHEAPEWAEAK